MELRKRIHADGIVAQRFAMNVVNSQLGLLQFYFPTLDNSPAPENSKLNCSKCVLLLFLLWGVGCSPLCIVSWLVVVGGWLLVASCCVVAGGCWVAGCLFAWWPGCWVAGRWGAHGSNDQRAIETGRCHICLLYTSPSPRDS